MAWLGFLVVLTLLACSAAADGPNWLAQIGLDNSSFPYGYNDPFNYFGAFEGCIDDYPDARDVVEPWGPIRPQLWFVGDQRGDNPTYPEGGLEWDIREPYDRGFKVWKATAYLRFEGYDCDIVYNFDPVGGHPLPEGWICRLDTDGEINPDNYLDLGLYEYGLNHLGTPGGDAVIIDTIPQTGEIETWYIIAGIPEPGLAQLAGLMVGAGFVIQRLRRK